MRPGRRRYNESMKKNPVMRATALLLSFALIHISFGPEAWAQLVPIANVSAPVNGGASAAAGAAMSRQNGAVTVMPTVSAISASPLTLSAPSAIPSLPVSAMNAPVVASAASSRASVAAAPAAPIPTRAAASTTEKSSSDKAASGAVTAAAPVEAASETDIQSGPKTATIGRRVAARFAELRSFFGRKSAQSADSAPAAHNDAPAVAVEQAAAYSTESGLSPATPESLNPQADADRAPPTPAAESKPAKSWFGLGATVTLLLGAMLTMQVGLEAQGAAMAQLTENAFGDFSILAQVSIFAQIGSMVGQQLSQAVIAKLGLAKTYYVAHFLRAISFGTMVFLIGSGMMPLSLMYLFYAANGVMTGIAFTADGTLRKMIIGSAPGAQEKFRTIWQFTAEIIGVIAPIAFSALVVTIGPSLVTGIYPAAILLALMLLIAKKVLPTEATAQLGEKTGFTQTIKDIVGALGKAVRHPITAIGSILSGIKNAAVAIGLGLKDAAVAAVRTPIQAVAHPKAAARGLGQWFKGSSMYKGFQFVWHTPALRYSFMGAATFDIMNVFLYRLFAPGYGKLIAGAAGMSPIAGMVVGLFSFGGLITAVMLLAMQRKLKAKAEKSESEAAEAQRKSVLRWMMLGIPAILLLGTFAISLPSLGAAVALPSFLSWAGAMTLPAAAMVVFGFFQVAASIKLNAFFIDSLPDPKTDPANKEKVQQSIAFEGSAMTAMSIIGMLAMKPMFGSLATFDPFPWIAGAMVPIALALFIIQRKLAAATKPEVKP